MITKYYLVNHTHVCKFSVAKAQKKHEYIAQHYTQNFTFKKKKERERHVSYAQRQLPSMACPRKDEPCNVSYVLLKGKPSTFSNP